MNRLEKNVALIMVSLITVLLLAVALLSSCDSAEPGGAADVKLKSGTVEVTPFRYKNRQCIFVTRTWENFSFEETAGAGGVWCWGVGDD